MYIRIKKETMGVFMYHKIINYSRKRKSTEAFVNTFSGIVAVSLFAYIVYVANTGRIALPTSASSIFPSSKYGDRELPIYSVETEEKKIALTFDAAWGAEDFDSIMDTLDKHQVKVTFFMTGGWVEAYPDCVKKLVEKGHDLGNHSEHHYDMATLSKDEITNEIQSVHDKVKELTGYEMTLFRPPFGSYNNEVIKIAYNCKYYPIQWSVDSLDWKDYGEKAIIDRVCNDQSLEPGAIILCHNGAKYTAKALDTLLTKLEEKGYQLVPVSELIMKEKYHMDVTGKQVAD